MKHIIFVIFLCTSAIFAQSPNTVHTPDSDVLPTNAKAAAKNFQTVELNNRAVELCLKNRSAEAVPLLRKAIEIEPDTLTFRKNLGIAFYMLKDYEQAVEFLEQVRAKDPAPDAKTLVFLGEALFAVGKNAESLTVLKQALEIEPDNAIARYNYGSVLQELKQYKEAIKQYDKAVALQPDLAKAFNNRGMTHYLSGDYQKAAADLQKALALDASIPEVHNNLGVVFSQTGKKKQAHKHFLEAARLRPDYNTAQFNLALSYQELGKRDEAFQHFLRLKSIDTNLAERLRKEMTKSFVINASENGN